MDMHKNLVAALLVTLSAGVAGAQTNGSSATVTNNPASYGAATSGAASSGSFTNALPPLPLIPAKARSVWDQWSANRWA